MSYNGKQNGVAADVLGADTPAQPGLLLDVARGIGDTTASAHLSGAKVILVALACVGDCNTSEDVTVNELLSMVSITLGNANLNTCVAGDGNQNGEITINEILAAVSNALNGCPK